MVVLIQGSEIKNAANPKKAVAERKKIEARIDVHFASGESLLTPC